MVARWFQRKYATIKRMRNTLYELDQIRERLGNLENVPYEIVDVLRNDTIRLPIVAPIEDTLKKLNAKGLSICRFGDGEFRLALGESIEFQESVPELSRRLRQILSSDTDQVLVGIPDVFGSLEGYTDSVREFWRAHLVSKRHQIYECLDFNKNYHDAQITRPYIQYLDKSRAGDRFRAARQLWERRSVVIVEGANTRLGRGNDLLDNALSVERIICPPRHAFAKYNEILSKTLALSQDKLVLLALGPTATLLAFDLAHQGRQAIDLGHIDIEYEWYLRKATSKVPVPGKHVNEARSKGDLDPVVDHALESQVICRIA